MAEISAERLREIRERLNGLLVAGIEDFEVDAADLLAEVERLRTTLAERDKLVAALTETAEWAFEAGGWRLWYFAEVPSDIVRTVTNYDTVQDGEPLKTRILPYLRAGGQTEREGQP